MGGYTTISYSTLKLYIYQFISLFQVDYKIVVYPLTLGEHSRLTAWSAFGFGREGWPQIDAKAVSRGVATDRVEVVIEGPVRIEQGAALDAMYHRGG